MMSRLKSELSWLRKKGAIRAGHEDAPGRSCGRCHTELGFIINRGAFCPSCGQRVCKQCREFVSPGTEWVCLVCRKQIEIRLATGEWMNEFIRRPSRRRSRDYETPAQTIKKTLVKRSWTISGPSGVGRDAVDQFVPIRQVPRKPPRRSPPTDENKQPPEYQPPPEKPCRRYSMGSYDGMSTQARSSRDPTTRSTPLTSYGHHPHPSNRPHNERLPPKYYFFGVEPHVEVIRPSTLPRKPHYAKTTAVHDEQPDPARFHSIPRNRPRSLSGGQRGGGGRVEPVRVSVSTPPMKDNYLQGRYVSSGPVTSTPITADNPPRSKPNITVTRHHHQEYGHPLSNVPFFDNRIRSHSDSSEIRRGERTRDVEGGGKRLKPFSNKEKRSSQSYPVDSGVSGSSRCVTPETGDENEYSTPKKISNRNRMPRSNTSISSGAATTRRQKKIPSNHASVRRCKSFQAESTVRPSSQEERMSKGQVARYVQELEQGIQRTVAHMNPKKCVSDSGSLNSSPSASRSSSENRNSSLRDGGAAINLRVLRQESEASPPSQTSDHSSDVILDSNKILPGGDDYKIVFISSDSSKDSEMNSSIDSDNPVTPPTDRKGICTDSDTTEFMESDRDDCIRKAKRKKNLKDKLHKKRFVDVAVMTEDDYNSDEGSEGEIFNDASLSLSLRVPSPLNEGRNVKHNSINMVAPKPFVQNAHTSPSPLNTLNPRDLKEMLKQTETVQAEAQMLQRALMGSFDVSERHRRENPGIISSPNYKNSETNLPRPPAEIPRQDNISSRYQVSPSMVNRNYGKNENIYENVDIIPVKKILPIEKKTVCTQTDPESLPWEESDSFETDDYSDVSSDSLKEQIKSPFDNQTSNTIPAIHPDARNYPTNESSREPHRESFGPPFYLTTPTTFPPRPPQNLRLTLNQNTEPSVFISRDSEAERRHSAVCSDAKSVVVAGASDSRSVRQVRDCDANAYSEKYSTKLSPASEFNNPVQFLKNERNDGRFGDSPFHLTNKTCTFGALLPSAVIKKQHLNASMSSSPYEREATTATQEVGDVDAAKKAIIIEGKDTSTPAEEGEGGAPLSSTSEEDTDEEVHASGSYDIAPCEDLNTSKESDTWDTADIIPTTFDDLAELPTEKESSVSGSDTDDGKHVTGEYSFTKMPSSESEKENEAGVSTETDEKEDRISIDSEEDDKAELPECDQAFSDEALLDADKTPAAVSDSGAADECDLSNLRVSGKCNTDSSSLKDNDLVDNNIENKSETESNLGAEMEASENSNNTDSEILSETSTMDDDKEREKTEENDKKVIVCDKNKGKQTTSEQVSNIDKEVILKEDPNEDIVKEERIISEKSLEKIDEIIDELQISPEEGNQLESESQEQKIVLESSSLMSPVANKDNSNINLEDIDATKTTTTNATTTTTTNAIDNAAVEGSTNNGSESTAPEITGSTEVEQNELTSCLDQSVISDDLIEKEENSRHSCEFSEIGDIECDTVNVVIDNDVNNEECDEVVIKYSSSESGQSSGGESEREEEKPEIKTDSHLAQNNEEKVNKEESNRPMSIEKCNFKDTSKRESPFTRRPQFQTNSICSPPVPARRAKRSSSSDGLSSSSDIERSDADASDSADAVSEGRHLRSLRKKFHFSDLEEDPNRDSDGPSSADSVLQGTESEFQCSDGSEEGNLISIVAVGDGDSIYKKSTQGKIYIRSDSTDSDVQIKPTCIVVTGSSGIESGEDGDSEEMSQSTLDEEGSDVTILEVTSDHRKDHIMSVRVTSPKSSRNASPTRSKVHELQSMILTTRESQQQVRSSPVELKEPSSLANYFTVTLGTNSPLTPRRTNKTPEVRRRKLPDMTEGNSPISNSSAATPTPTLTPSPSHTPSPTVTPIPDHSEGDLLAYEENHGVVEEPYDREEFGDEHGFNFYDESGAHFEYSDGIHIEDADGTFDSIEDAESISESNYSETSSEEGFERDEDIRGYAKRAYSFTLHTIMEESCEESDYEKRAQEESNVRRDPSGLENYYFGLGSGPADSKKYANEESEYSDTFSETSSSIFSEGMESIDQTYEDDMAEELASTRLEKYFSGFLGFERQPSIRSIGEESEIHTDESGSVGSDSEGSASPKQIKRKCFRSRGVRSVSSCRSHGYSSDKGEGVISDGSHNSGEGEENDKTLVSGEDEFSTESEEIAFEKTDGQFDTIKRRKKKKMLSEMAEKKIESEKNEMKHHTGDKDEEINNPVICQRLFADHLESASQILKDKSDVKSPTTNESLGRKTVIRDNVFSGSDLAVRKYQSRDSGFIGSSDDLLKDKPDAPLADSECKEGRNSESSNEETGNSKRTVHIDKDNEKQLQQKERKGNDENGRNGKSESEDKSSNDGKVSRSSTGSSADLPAYSHSKGSQHLSRKDSFNNWSSDEETNIMMNKMRMFFKNMFSNTSRDIQKGQRMKSPQLVMFEAKLTSLMRTVPGLNDEQVREIVEYLSSEETWSDSYDSSDYTSSDIEASYARLDQADPELKSELQEQISASCQQIIRKFDQNKDLIDMDPNHPLFGAFSESSEDISPASKDTVFVYQKVMSSLSNMKPDSDRGSIGSGSQSTSPPMLAKVIHHIGNRIVALMHEVSTGSENGEDLDSFHKGQIVTSSPRSKLFLPKKHKTADSASLDSSIDKSSLTSTSFESEESPTDTEQSPDSEIGTPKAVRLQRHPLNTEDFISSEHQRSIFPSHDSSRYPFRAEVIRPSVKSISQRSLEERGAPSNQYYGREKCRDNTNQDVEDDKFDVKGVPKLPKSNRRSETRKAKSHLNLEKIHQEDVKNTGERSESLGDLLDRVRSSDYSSSYEQLDSDSTLKASDSLDRHIGSSSSNVRLNASSRGSLNTSSRGSLAASSRGSLNASSKGSLQGSSGPEEEEDKKIKKLSFFRYPRRSSATDTAKENPSQELKSTTLPRSNPAQILSTGTLPRSQPPQSHSTRPSTGFFNTLSSIASDRQTNTTTTGPRSARYHAPGYRPPPSSFQPKRAISTPTLRKDKLWHNADESGASLDDGVGPSVSASSTSFGSLHKPPSSSYRLPPRGGVASNDSSRAASPLGETLRGSLGRTSGNESVGGGSSASFENSPDEEDAKRFEGSEGGRSSLSTLGPKSRSDSLASVCSTGADGRYGSVSVMGELRASLQYNYKEGQIECHVLQCRDLAPVDAKRNRSDPYVKAYLLPDKSKNSKRKTKVRRHTLNPIFEEILKFTTTLSDLESRTLWLSVWHSDMFGRNDFLGEVLIPLSDALFEDSAPKWYTLQDRTEPLEEANYGAFIIVALKFVPPDALSLSGVGGTSKRFKKSRGALQVRVKEASGLISARPQSPPDPVCKGVLLPEKGKSSKQKTSVCRKTSTPKWNYTMTFDDVTMQELMERSLELSVWDHDRFGGSDFIGGCRLNMGGGNQTSDWLDAAGLELKLWSQMLERPNLWVESCILLRSVMERPVYSSCFTE